MDNVLRLLLPLTLELNYSRLTFITTLETTKGAENIYSTFSAL